MIPRENEYGAHSGNPGAEGRSQTTPEEQVTRGMLMSHEAPRHYTRHTRMPIRTVVLVSMGARSWETEAENISATGLLALRPAGWDGVAGERCVLDLVLGAESNIHVEAIVSRLNGTHIAFAYTSIPEDKQHLLWNLLGEFADEVEGPRPDPAQ